MPALLYNYATWHYSRGFFNCVGIIGNYIWFLSHLFSIPFLLRTFFSPWKRLNVSYPKGVNVDKWLEALGSNLVARGAGMLVRAVMIIAGTVTLAISLFVGLILIVVWIVLPALLVTGFVIGCGLLLI